MPSRATVVLRNIAFKPSKLVIRSGGVVRWLWRDGTGIGAVYHTVTSVGRFRFRGSAARDSGGYSVRFTRPGTYHYICLIHYGMHGEVIVR